MNILGIETSCDESGAAVVLDGEEILSNVVVSSLKEHQEFGGIIPEIASRRQLECLSSVTEEALSRADLGWNEIDAIAVTTEPGLIGSLLVGISFAKGLSLQTGRPCLSVNHIQAHLYAPFLKESSQPFSRPELPAVGLVVSGGHTALYRVSEDFSFTLLGETRDDAVGEAFDKTGRVLGLGYPGGPAIDRLTRGMTSSPVRLGSARMKGSLDFSYSGLKTAVLYYHRDHKDEPSYDVRDVAFRFQNEAVEILVEKAIQACLQEGLKTLLVGGGVAANSLLRRRLDEDSAGHGIQLSVPPLSLCLDNAAMIAGLAFHRRQAGTALENN